MKNVRKKISSLMKLLYQKSSDKIKTICEMNCVDDDEMENMEKL